MGYFFRGHCFKTVGFLAGMVLLATGCSTTLKPVALEDHGYFPGSREISADGVKIEKPFKDEFRQLAYVETDAKSEKYNDFFLQSFENMDAFRRVVQKSYLEDYVFDNDLADQVSSVSDRVGWYNLSNHIGPFLVIQPYAEWVGGYDFIAEIKAYDARTGDMVLHISNKAFNWAGLDKPLFYPLMNAFIDWTRGRPISTKESGDSAE